MKIKMKDIVVIGFALFAMFFGAGNLVFPPYLGVLDGTKWFIGFIAFLFADGGLALLGVIAMTRTGGDLDALYSRAGKKIGLVIGTASILCIGPFLAIPRTAAVTFEVGINPVFGDSFSPVVFSIIFFAITLFLTIKPSKVVDIVGQFLTPALLICLAVLIVKGIISPLGTPLERTLVDNVVVRGIYDGYQTMDAMASCIFAGIIISSVKAKGYTDQGSLVKATVYAGIVAVAGLAFVYGGLSYLGATVSPMFDDTVGKSALIISITESILGGPGKVILAIIVALACLTTSIGLTSACGNYFRDITGGKLKYERTVIVVCIFSAIVSNLGLDKIISMAVPILLTVYPAVVTYIILGLFSDKISNNNIFKFAIWVSVILGLLSALPAVPGLADNAAIQAMGAKLNALPGGEFGFFWIIPVAVAGLVGKFLPSKVKA